MKQTEKNGARLNFRLPPALKSIIEEAASQRGQSITEYAIATLVQDAQKVLRESEVTRLTRRDRDLVVALLDDPTAKPNRALRDAAKRYKKRLG